MCLMSAAICTCFSPSSIVSAAARSCASVSSAVAVSDACSSLVYALSMSPMYAVNLYFHSLHVP